VNADSQMQLNVRCQKAHVGFAQKHLKPKPEVSGDEREELGGDGTYRDLVVSGGASLFDLTKAILLGFGLNISDYDHRPNLGKLVVGQGTLESMVTASSGKGKLDTQNSILVTDVHTRKEEVPGLSDGHEVVHGPITGLHREKQPEFGMDTAVTPADMKKVRLFQLLDKPRYSSDVRSRDQGMRRGLYMYVLLPERFAFCSSVIGGCLTNAVQQTFYEFSITLEVVGTKQHMGSSFQARLPRCVGGAGKVHGGNEVDWEYGDEEDHTGNLGTGPSIGLAELDAVNVKFNNGRQVRGFVFGGSGDPDDDVMRISGWLCRPLFHIDYDTMRATGLGRGGW
jgi:hypothetical protein